MRCFRRQRPSLRSLLHPRSSTGSYNLGLGARSAQGIGFLTRSASSGSDVRITGYVACWNLRSRVLVVQPAPGPPVRDSLLVVHSFLANSQAPAPPFSSIPLANLVYLGPRPSNRTQVVHFSVSRIINSRSRSLSLPPPYSHSYLHSHSHSRRTHAHTRTRTRTRSLERSNMASNSTFKAWRVPSCRWQLGPSCVAL